MRKILEYSEFVSGESEKMTPEYLRGELLRIQRKWFADGGKVIDPLLIHENFSKVLIEIGKLIPLDSDDADEIAKTLYDSSFDEKIGYTVYYLFNYGISVLNSPNKLVEKIPIEWTEVK